MLCLWGASRARARESLHAHVYSIQIRLLAVPWQMVWPGGGGQGQPPQDGGGHAGVVVDMSIQGLASGGQVELVEGACPASTLEQLNQIDISKWLKFAYQCLWLTQCPVISDL